MNIRNKSGGEAYIPTLSILKTAAGKIKMIVCYIIKIRWGSPNHTIKYIEDNSRKRENEYFWMPTTILYSFLGLDKLLVVHVWFIHTDFKLPIFPGVAHKVNAIKEKIQQLLPSLHHQLVHLGCCGYQVSSFWGKYVLTTQYSLTKNYHTRHWFPHEIS